MLARRQVLPFLLLALAGHAEILARRDDVPAVALADPDHDAPAPGSRISARTCTRSMLSRCLTGQPASLIVVPGSGKLPFSCVVR